MSVWRRLLASFAMLSLAAIADAGPTAAQTRSANKACLSERPAGSGLVRLCIRRLSYPRDVCRAIEQLASETISTGKLRTFILTPAAPEADGDRVDD